MSDNEKRAHDFTIAICSKIFDISKDVAILNTEDLSFDFYKEYVSIYNRTLELFNRDFPNGR